MVWRSPCLRAACTVSLCVPSAWTCWRTPWPPRSACTASVPTASSLRSDQGGFGLYVGFIVFRFILYCTMLYWLDIACDISSSLIWIIFSRRRLESVIPKYSIHTGAVTDSHTYTSNIRFIRAGAVPTHNPTVLMRTKNIRQLTFFYVTKTRRWRAKMNIRW